MKRRSDCGFALLLVFVMAGAIAISLYMAMPRVAFEAQRAQEGLLIDRGEQYVRAIRLFVRQTGRYPQSVEELENFNNGRSLRKRYSDPMTGKGEWRIIHVAGPGMFTDSVVKQDTSRNPSVPDPGARETPNSAGVAPSEQTQETSRPVQRKHRHSEQAEPESWEGHSPVFPSATLERSETAPFSRAGTISTPDCTAPSGEPDPTAVQNVVEKPPPGGSNRTLRQGQVFIAGIASTLKKQGIKLYHGRQKYNEWEFAYDVMKDRGSLGATGQTK